MQINYAGKISKKEYLKAILLNNQQLRIQKWIFGIALAVIAFSIGSLMIEDFQKYKSILQSPGILIPLFVLTFPWWMPYLQVTSYNQPGNIYRNNVFGLINDDEITISSGLVKSSSQWNAYTSWRIKDEILLLYQGKNCFNIFTRAMFASQDEWNNFLSLIKSKVSTSKKKA